MTVVIDGTRTTMMVKWADGRDAWTRARLVTHTIEPCTAAQARAHLALNPECGCVVWARRGPKGGWVSAAWSDWYVPKGELHNGTLHVGWLNRQT